MVKYSHMGEETEFDTSGIQLLASCPSCHTDYNQPQAQILESSDNGYLVFLVCQSCQTSVLGALNYGQMGVRSTGLVTDLQAEEVMPFSRDEGVNLDDVLAMEMATTPLF